jgi:hypothetical protein
LAQAISNKLRSAVWPGPGAAAGPGRGLQDEADFLLARELMGAAAAAFA